MENNLPNAFAFFRLPQSKQIWMAQGDCLNQLSALQDIPDNSFVLSPFNEGNLAYYFSFDQLKPYQKQFIEPNQATKKNVPINSDVKSKENYINLVGKAKVTIKESGASFKKVVLANAKTIKNNEFNPISFFEQLESAYPNAFVYCAYTPTSEWWIGASPETFICSQNTAFTTIALAGTLPPNTTRNFTSKEIEEQHLVTLFIEQQLKDADIPFQKTVAAPFSTGHLTHLKTSYLFGSNQNTKQIYALIAKLNPTPAVAGLPKEKAIDFISKHENLNRSFYSGYIGLKEANNLQLFVNLRCLKWDKEVITLYAGAGITADSNPESEWEETQHKMNTLEKFLFIIFATGFIML
jgi:isochorismate synthase